MLVTLLVVLCVLPSYIRGGEHHHHHHVPDDLSLFPPLVPWAGAYLPASGRYAECARDSLRFEEALAHGSLWAARMLDASERGVSGALWGARFHLGSFDGCLSVAEVSPISARYCLVNVSHQADQNLPSHEPWGHVENLDPDEDVRVALKGHGQREGYFKMGEVLVAMCVPYSCDAPALETALRLHSGHGRGINITVDPQRCTALEDAYPEPDWHVTIFWTVIAALTIVTIAAPYLGWKAWDWRTHLHSLAIPDPRTGGIDWSPLSGIRCLNTLLIVIIHRPGVDLTLGSHSNQIARDENYISAKYAVVYHGHMFVETFLCMSGMLFVLSSTGKPAWKSIVGRISRLLPLYIVMVYFSAYVGPKLFNGPMFKHRNDQESNACKEWGWANLLFIHNYVCGGVGVRGCLNFSWTLAVDMQLYLVSLLLRPYLRRGAALILPLVAVSVLTPLLAGLRFDLPAVMNWTPQTAENVYKNPMWVYFYVPTHMRATPYFIGMGLGMVIYKLKVMSVRPSKTITWVGLLGGLLVMTAAFFSSMLVMDASNPVSKLNAALYHSLMPVVWTVALGVVIVMLLFGETTIIHRFLSWQPLVSLGRLTFGVYMCSIILQFYIVSTKRDTTQMVMFSAMMNGISDLVIAFIISLWLFLILEAPCRTLVKQLLQERSPITATSEEKQVYTNGKTDGKKHMYPSTVTNSISLEQSEKKEVYINGKAEQSEKKEVYINGKAEQSEKKEVYTNGKADGKRHITVTNSTSLEPSEKKEVYTNGKTDEKKHL